MDETAVITVYFIGFHSVTDTVLIGERLFPVLEQIKSTLDTNNNQC